MMNKPLQGKRCGKIFVLLQEPEADLTVFQVPAHRVSTPWGNQEVDALANIYALATDWSVDIANWEHRRTGHCSASTGWHIYKEAGCLYYSVIWLMQLYPILSAPVIPWTTTMRIWGYPPKPPMGKWLANWLHGLSPWVKAPNMLWCVSSPNVV